VKNPIGMHGFRLDADAHVVTASAASIQNLVKCIYGAGVEVEDLILQPLAASEAVLRPDEREAGVALVDMGGGTTDIAIFKEGSVCFTSILPLGGYQITKDIAIGLNIPFEMAEKIKIKYGNLSLSMEVAKSKINGSELGLKDGQDILLQDLGDIIRARVDEILRMVFATLPQPQYLPSLIPAGIVLSGGTANLLGIDALAREIFRLPVRIGIPKDIYGLADILYDPAYATSVGLLLWGAKEYQGEWRIAQGRVNPLIKLFHRLFRR
jgi:cell division protein FtsA